MRISRHSMFMQMAQAAARRSTCYRLNVGALVVQGVDVLGIGYNGAPSGQPHCTGQGCQYFDSSKCGVMHAEENAIGRAASRAKLIYRHHIDCVLYVTHSPCDDCVTRVLQGGLRFSEVYFETTYRITAPIDRLLYHEVKVFHLLPSGMMVDKSTGLLCEQ